MEKIFPNFDNSRKIKKNRTTQTHGLIQNLTDKTESFNLINVIHLPPMEKH